MRIAIAMVLGTLVVSSLSFAAEAEHAPVGPTHATHELTYPHPTPPDRETTWPVPMLMIVAGMFIAAAVIGPIVRSEMIEESDAHGHDAHGHGHDDHGHHH